MADAESFTTVYDSCWFGTPPPPRPPASKQPSHRCRPTPTPTPPTRIRSSHHHKRSMSTESTSTNTSHSRSSISPDPTRQHLLHHRHLTTVFSGQEINNLAEKTEQPTTELEKKKNRVKQRVYSKSLSELEVEEVRGFIELGFVFSEEDVEDTDLISIVPGIKRLGRLRTENGRGRQSSSSSSNRSRSVGDSAIRRPYLSETWVDDESSYMNTEPLKSWKIPFPSSESDMKRNLRCWAHSVAESIISDDHSVSLSASPDSNR